MEPLVYCSLMGTGKTNILDPIIYRTHLTNVREIWYNRIRKLNQIGSKNVAQGQGLRCSVLGFLLYSVGLHSPTTQGKRCFVASAPVEAISRTCQGDSGWGHVRLCPDRVKGDVQGHNLGEYDLKGWSVTACQTREQHFHQHPLLCAGISVRTLE